MPNTKLRLAKRAEQISPFHVMDILAQAKQLEAQGRQIIHLEVGEPDFSTPQPIIDAGVAALHAGKTHYTPALGLPELRQAIADWYLQTYQVAIPVNRIIITPGASGGLLLLMGALLESGGNILLADPGYPCNRHFARFVEGRAKMIAVSESNGYQLTAADIERHWDEHTDMALLASPSNPTGSILSRLQLSTLSAAIQEKQGVLAVDEIYHGLTYDDVDMTTALAVDPHAFVLNSFSKYFGMTGWRLGWLVVPEAYTSVMDKLAQNLFLAAPTVSQYAALAAFETSTLAILEQRRCVFEQRRNTLLSALQSLGFDIKATPQGAFYIYADCQHFLNEQVPDSMALSQYWLNEAGVAVTPGDDFGVHGAQHHIRFAYTQDETKLLEAVARIAQLY